MQPESVGPLDSMLNRSHRVRGGSDDDGDDGGDDGGASKILTLEKK